jgi:cellulose synthase (UDP-forming)
MFGASPDVATIVALDLGVLLAAIALASALNPARTIDRWIFGGLTAVLICSYFSWRLTDTLPSFELSFGGLWQRLYLLFEAVAILYTLMSIVILLRYADHSGEADVAEAALEAEGAWPGVDVFICTYNEPVDVLEKSVLLAKAMDYPRLRIFVLDDTRRAWLRDYCA